MILLHRTLSLRGNPLCEDPDWSSYVKALLPNLIYLECQAITADDREKATARHQVSFEGPDLFIEI